jgi:hypothetical protein
MCLLCSLQPTTVVADCISTIAGTGVSGYNGDGIRATSAQLNDPYGVVVDALGRVLIAEYDSSRVRRIETNGTIFTIAGNGTGGYNGDRMSTTSAKLNKPAGVVVDAFGCVFHCWADFILTAAQGFEQWYVHQRRTKRICTLFTDEIVADVQCAQLLLERERLD